MPSISHSKSVKIWKNLFLKIHGVLFLENSINLSLEPYINPSRLRVGHFEKINELVLSFPIFLKRIHMVEF